MLALVSLRRLLDPSPDPSPTQGGEILPLSASERGLGGEVFPRMSSVGVGNDAGPISLYGVQQ